MRDAFFPSEEADERLREDVEPPRFSNALLWLLPISALYTAARDVSCRSRSSAPNWRVNIFSARCFARAFLRSEEDLFERSPPSSSYASRAARGAKMSSAGSSRMVSSKRVREEDPGIYENVLFERALRTLGRAGQMDISRTPRGNTRGKRRRRSLIRRRRTRAGGNAVTARCRIPRRRTTVSSRRRRCLAHCSIGAPIPSNRRGTHIPRRSHMLYVVKRNDVGIAGMCHADVGSLDA